MKYCPNWQLKLSLKIDAQVPSVLDNQQVKNKDVPSPYPHYM